MGERAATGLQVADQFRGLRGSSDRAGLVWMAWGVVSEQDRQRCEMGRDLVLTDTVRFGFVARSMRSI